MERNWNYYVCFLSDSFSQHLPQPDGKPVVALVFNRVDKFLVWPLVEEKGGYLACVHPSPESLVRSGGRILPCERQRQVCKTRCADVCLKGQKFSPAADTFPSEEQGSNASAPQSDRFIYMKVFTVGHRLWFCGKGCARLEVLSKFARPPVKTSLCCGKLKFLLRFWIVLVCLFLTHIHILSFLRTAKPR